MFEQRVDNIVGVAYSMDMLELIKKGDMLETAVVGDMAHKPAYFVPDSMLIWNLLREFRIRKVHMVVVLNEYRGTVGIVTLEDVVEEIVGELFDENDSKTQLAYELQSQLKESQRTLGEATAVADLITEFDYRPILEATLSSYTGCTDCKVDVA
ncbi:putative DUF21 domain-containing protein At3g13070, chloroplastic [Helianthus annuus]|uniref:putative DUF21 domain-containing protein At3g13070, chloroplastic n=1 Tax=Helianthus annuus TaxID=4232 RepID=UPI001652FCEC|nr:putative DUF21 domain-containing protein At3g13070, chloroplastic [Helianthus annuus]